MGRLAKALELAEKISEAKTTEEAPAPPAVAPTAVRGPLPDPPTDPSLVTLNDADSPAAEEYRRLKSNIMSHLRKDEPSNVVLITSALAGEGKSITAANLAIFMAQEFNGTVLLIDADLRKPDLAHLLLRQHVVQMAQMGERELGCLAQPDRRAGARARGFW